MSNKEVLNSCQVDSIISEIHPSVGLENSLDDESDEVLKNKEDTSDKETLTRNESQTDTKFHDKSHDAEDPKPRIVLTFRSEKSGAKSSNMKIVSTEEKSEEVTPKRSCRTRAPKWDSEDENEVLVPPKKHKTNTQSFSENDETSDSSHTTTKRSTRRRSKDFCDNVLANAIARKEKSYNETSCTTHRLSRRIKPTAKILANEELRIGVESQNNARMGVTPDKCFTDGVKTRRSTRNRKSEHSSTSSDKRILKHLSPPAPNSVNDEEELISIASSKSPTSDKKLKHFSELGLRAREDNTDEEDIVDRGSNCEEEVEIDDEGDDDTEVISQLIEADDDSTETSDDEFLCDTGTKKGKKPRRSTRLCPSFASNMSEDRSSPVPQDEEQISQRRRSSRKTRASDSYFPEYDNAPAGGDEGSEATCPEDESNIIATCFCTKASNVYAAPEELIEPVFCQAVESVDGIRVGCSHGAQKEDDGQYAALVRAGLRAPYFLACRLHALQLQKHMCCPNCGLFCSQGIFYQCSEGHFFHLECGIPHSDGKQKPGCPHCGVYSYRWQPVNKECVKVSIEMKCSNKRIFLPEQRVQCTPAYLGFSSLSPSQLQYDPVIPEDLLPSPPINLQQLFQKPQNLDDIEPELVLQRLYDGIMKGETATQLIPHMVPGMDVNKSLEYCAGGTLVHAAASCGNLAALYILHYAGANLNATDSTLRTPLMLAILALLDKTPKVETPDKINKGNKSTTEIMDMNKNDDIKIEDTVKKTEDKFIKDAVNEEVRNNDKDLMKTIRYLVAADCHINLPGPDGMTALHMAAQHGGADVCSVILTAASAEVDPRDHGGWTPLVWAAENKHSEVVKVLLSHGADVMATDNEGNAVVHWCTLAGDARCLQRLIETEPRAVQALNAHTDTPLHVAARQGHYSCVVVLLARGARTDVENSAGELPVEVASGQCQTAVSLNMQMTIALREKTSRRRLLSNDISNGRETFPMPCVNEVDDAPLPEDFTYVTSHVMPQQIAIDSTIDNMQGCECKDGDCSTSTCACCALSVRRWYVRGRLLPNFPYHEPPMLFECNETCGCNVRRCTNQVLRRACRAGSLFVRAQVFRTGTPSSSTRGWGLRATALVQRGAPVATYCGELLVATEADARVDDQYMFALDLKLDLLENNAERVQLCVDAARFGSAARFVNHSCRPNLAPVRVFTGARDLRLPTVALFALRDVHPGEEFTFDYGDKFWSVKSKWMKCECGSSECRYPTKTSEDID